MKSVKLIYFPLIKESTREKLNLKKFSNYLLKLNEGIDLIKENFSEIKINHSLGSDKYFGGNPAENMESVLQHHVNIYGEEEILRKAGSSFMDLCGIPYGAGWDSEILEDYLESKNKKLKGSFLNSLEPYKRKPIVDKK